MSTNSRDAAKGRQFDADKAGYCMPDAAPVDGKGQGVLADKAVSGMPDPSPIAAGGLADGADKSVADVPAAANDGESLSTCADKASKGCQKPSAETGRSHFADKAVAGMPVSASLDQLAELQVRRKFYIGTVNKQTNAVKALVRRALGWRYDEEETSREKTNARAARIVAAALAGKEQKAEDAEVYSMLAFDLATVGVAIDPCQRARHEIELEMKRIVRNLPIWQWALPIKGLGELGLAVILAEAGDLSEYPKKGHLWKRLGLAPFEGRAYSTWRMKGGLDSEDWVEAGYSPRRRAEIYSCVSEPLFRAQSVAQGPYRAIYDRRRAHTAETQPEWIKAHSHMDGLRIMTKHLLRDLWQEWRRAGIVMPERAGMGSPVAEPIRREAVRTMPERASGVVPTGEPFEREAIFAAPKAARVHLPTVHPVHANAEPSQ